jgi:hypothetical protein
MGKKLNRKQLLEREITCLSNIGEGLTKNQNIDNLIDTYGMSAEKAELLYFQTTRRIAGLREATFEELKAQILCQLDVLYKKTVGTKAYLTALNVLNSKARVAGLIDQNKSGKEEKGVDLPSVVQVKEADFSGK